MGKTKKTPLLIITALILIAGVALAINIMSRNNRIEQNDNTNYGPATEEQKRAAEEKKISDEVALQHDTPPISEPVTIMSVEQDEQSRLIVKTKLPGADWQSCELLLTKGERTITKNADALFQPSFSTCLGFTLESTELESGTWDMQLTATKSDGTKETAITAVTIR